MGQKPGKTGKCRGKIFWQKEIGWRSGIYTETFGGTALVVSVAATPSQIQVKKVKKHD